MAFLDDGTATVALVGDGGVSSSTLSGPGLAQTGNETTVDSITPTAQLPDAAVSASETANTDSYGSDTNVFFKLGNLTDADADADEEFALVEFNAIVANVAAAAPGATLDNSFEVHLGSNPNISVSLPVGVSVVAPALSVVKTALDPSEDAGEPVHFEVVVTAAAGATRSDAFETAIVDPLPAGLTLDLTDVAISTSGTVTGAIDASSGNTLRVDVGRMAPGATVTVTYTATLAPGVTPAQVLTNTAAASTTTLPGDGTTGNATGSDAGVPGGATGERDGSGGVNDLTAQASATVTLHSSSLAGHVYTDLDSDDDCRTPASRLSRAAPSRSRAPTTSAARSAGRRRRTPAATTPSPSSGPARTPCARARISTQPTGPAASARREASQRPQPSTRSSFRRTPTRSRPATTLPS